MHHLEHARILYVAGEWKRSSMYSFSLDATGPSMDRVVAYKYDMKNTVRDWPDELNANDVALCIETKRTVPNGTIRVPMIIPPDEFQMIIRAMLDVDEISTIHALAGALKEFRSIPTSIPSPEEIEMSTRAEP